MGDQQCISPQSQNNNNHNNNNTSISTSSKSQLESPFNDNGPGSSTSNKEKNGKKESTIENISTEVGSLTISNDNNIQGKYIGAATGSNFAKLFLKQMHLNKLGDINTSALDDFDSFDSSVTKSYAPLPPYRISRYAILKYINSVHIYYPLILLQELKDIFEKMYTSPREVPLYDKFVLFIVISIGLDRSEKDPELVSYDNQFKPVEYFNTAYRYLEEILSNRSERSLQALLLVIIWLLNTNVLKDDNGDLWHLGRFSMSLAMELGVHRFNPDWDFGEVKNELRNRLFWCTYILERTIAMKFGRGLSLRKQAIDTPLPKLLKDDYLPGSSVNGSLKIYDQVQFKPSLLLINICEIYGDLLETVYISRTKGSNPLLSIEEIINYKSQLQISLTEWMLQIDKEIPNTLNCYYELKIRYCITSIILNRPSPSFLVPDTKSILICKENCKECIDSYCWLLAHGWKINPTCLHDLVNTGLSMIYCCWKTDTNSNLLKDFSMKTLNIMNEIVRYYPNFVKFKNLFVIVSSIIIDGFDNSNNMAASQNQNDFMFQHIPEKLQQFKESIQYPNTTNSATNNQMEFNDWFTKELFQDVFRQYYFQNNNMLDDLDQLFDYS